jgi:hypothetical protein
MNLGQDTGCHEGFLSFPQYLQANARIAPQLGQAFPSTSFPIHQSCCHLMLQRVDIDSVIK